MGKDVFVSLHELEKQRRERKNREYYQTVKKGIVVGAKKTGAVAQRIGNGLKVMYVGAEKGLTSPKGKKYRRGLGNFSDNFFGKL